MTEIAEQFSPEDNAADLSILYEVTGFQANYDDFDWDGYQDFEVPGSFNMVRQDKNEQTSAMREINKATRKATNKLVSSKDDDTERLDEGQTDWCAS